jgi:hypothetical protein
MAEVKTRGLTSLVHACAFAWLLTTGCSKQAVAPASASPPEVDVTPVVRTNVPIIQEWVANVDGFVNAQIQPSGQRLPIEANLQGRLFCRERASVI